MLLLLLSIGWVESSHNTNSYNEKENAIGFYQIREDYLKDANEYISLSNSFRTLLNLKDWKPYTHEEMYDIRKATIVVLAYFERYGKIYKLKTGNKTIPYLVLARIHNGGPNGWKKKATIGYMEKVNRAMNGKPWKQKQY